MAKPRLQPLQNTHKSNTNTNTKTKQNETRNQNKNKKASVFNMSFDICFNTGFSACFNLFQQPNQFFVHRFRTLPTFSAQIPISASAVARIIVSCSKNAHARRGLQEPPGRVIVSCLRLGGYLFLNNFSTSFFHNLCPKNDPKIEPKSMKNEVEKRTRK